MNSTSIFNVTPIGVKKPRDMNRTDLGADLSSRLSLNTPRNNTTFESTNWFGNNTLNSQSIDQSTMPANETDAELNVFTDLYPSFMKITTQTTQYNLLPTINAYLKECQRASDSIQNKLNSSRFYPNKVHKLQENLKLMKLEIDTWMLLEILLKERLSGASGGGGGDEEALLRSERELSDALFAKNSEMRQAQLIIDWLEYLVRSSDDNQHKLKLNFVNQNHGAWENTLLHLKQQQQQQASNTHRNIVTAMDPDAQTRQGKKLMELDEEDDRNLLKYLFYCIRSGQFNQACNTCEKSGQIWRAMALQGWKLFHNDNIRCLGIGGVVKETEGNQSRWLWRYACSQIISDKRVSSAEKGVLGCLIGHLPSMLTQCPSWHDHVWAYLKVFVDQQLQGHLRQHANILNFFNLHNDNNNNNDEGGGDDEGVDMYIGDGGYEDGELDGGLEACYPANSDKISNFESMFGKIESSTNDEVRRQSQFRFFIIQKFIILHQPDLLLEYMSSWCDNNINPHLLRTTTHLLLLLNNISPLSNSLHKERVLEAWVRHLMTASHHSLVAYYTAQLPPHTQTPLYASMLKDVRDTESRKECLRLAEEAGLDVRAVILLVVELSIKGDSTPPTININKSDMTNQDLTEEDSVKIGSIEWLTFDASCALMVVTEANYLLRLFLLSRKAEACKSLMAALPSDAVQVLLNETKEADESCQKHVDNVVGEFTCFTMYLTALDLFSDWFDHFHQSKPHKPQEAMATNQFAEKVSFEHSLKQYNTDMNRWKQVSNTLAERAVDGLKGVVTFNKGGWMVDLYEDDDHTRKQHLNLLRCMYIPSIFHLIIKVFSSLQRWSDCTSVADVLATKDYRLYEVFSEDEMERIMLELTSCMVQRVKAQEEGVVVE